MKGSEKKELLVPRQFTKEEIRNIEAKVGEYCGGAYWWHSMLCLNTHEVDIPTLVRVMTVCTSLEADPVGIVSDGPLFLRLQTRQKEVVRY